MKAEDKLWIRTKPFAPIKEELFICFCYIPPMGSTATCHNDAEWRCFESEVIQMAGKGNILLCGDMNARTGSKNDYIEKDTKQE